MSDTQSPDTARLRITLVDLEPEPWREIEVPLSMTFKGLHDAIQATFLWHDKHLWEFEIDGRRYGMPFDNDFGGEQVYKAATTRLTMLRETATTEFLYVYDMGDDWLHRIDVLELLATRPGSRLPRFLGGQWRTPPEDVGGAPGFEVFLEAIADPNHPEHADLLDWYGATFNPEDIDEQTIKAMMARLAKARPRKK